MTFVIDISGLMQFVSFVKLLKPNGMCILRNTHALLQKFNEKINTTLMSVQ